MIDWQCILYFFIFKKLVWNYGRRILNFSIQGGPKEKGVYVYLHIAITWQINSSKEKIPVW